MKVNVIKFSFIMDVRISRVFHSIPSRAISRLLITDSLFPVSLAF